MNLLVSFDQNYVQPLKTMLQSLFINNSGSSFSIYALCEGVSPLELEQLQQICENNNSEMLVIEIPKDMFGRAPSFRYYSKTMYYRLLAAELLPRTVKRVLYIDPDTLIINRLEPIYTIEMADYLFAAASHGEENGLTSYINKLRLNNFQSNCYFNSGVLLMDLDRMRSEVRLSDIYAYIEKNKQGLILPDQDVLNGLYGHRILLQDDSIWNYDARKFDFYWFSSQGIKGMDWVMNNTIILHFCGKQKPWFKDYLGYFFSLYKHYQRLS